MVEGSKPRQVRVVCADKNWTQCFTEAQSIARKRWKRDLTTGAWAGSCQWKDQRPFSFQSFGEGLSILYQQDLVGIFIELFTGRLDEAQSPFRIYAWHLRWQDFLHCCLAGNETCHFLRTVVFGVHFIKSDFTRWCEHQTLNLQGDGQENQLIFKPPSRGTSQ